MEKIFFKFLVFFHCGLVCYCLQPVPGMCADQRISDPDAVKQMEETIKKQEERIKQLQSQIDSQQPKAPKQELRGTEPSGPLPAQSKADLIEQALRESWGCCNANSRVVKVTEGLVSVHFNNIHDIITFFETGADGHARTDLAVFLKKAGLENGTIEYYNLDKRLYAISGGLTKAETVQYY